MTDKSVRNERFLYTPSVKDRDAVPLWLCFPSTYSIGMCSLGYLSIFRILDQASNVSPERIFTDTEKTFHSVKDLELFGFSFSFELDFLNILKVLQKYHLPFKSSERSDDHPIIFGGGPVLSANSEPYADIFDVITIGEGEELTIDMINAYQEVRDKSRKEKLIKFSQIPGIYVPSLYDVEYNQDNTIKSYIPNTSEASASIKKACIEDLSESIYTPILANEAVFSDMFLIETARGCPKKCRFCIASYMTLPARYPQYQSIVDAIDIGLSHTSKIGLLGALITEHPDFDKICQHILDKRKDNNISLSVASLRADKITPLIIKTLVEGGQRSATIAIESGSERLRKLINKNLTKDQILENVKIARENGLAELKIYGIIGLPTESMDDIKELADLMKLLKRENKEMKFTLSISSFVSKAQTPFQWSSRESIKTLKEKSDFLKKELMKANVLFKPTSLKWDFIQAVLSRGDRRLYPLLEKVFTYNGSLGSWSRSYKELTEDDGVDLPELEWYALRERLPDEIFPWEIINTGLSKESLFKDYEISYSKSMKCLL